MKFAIPLANGKLTAHFGHCQEFALIEVADNEIANKQIFVPPPHEPGILPRWLHELGADVIIAGGHEMFHEFIFAYYDKLGIQLKLPRHTSFRF